MQYHNNNNCSFVKKSLIILAYVLFLVCNHMKEAILVFNTIRFFRRIYPKIEFSSPVERNSFVLDLAPVVQKVDNAIHWINLYPVDNTIGFPNTYPLHIRWFIWWIALFNVLTEPGPGQYGSHLFTRLRTNRIKAMSRGFSWGRGEWEQTTDKICK